MKKMILYMLLSLWSQQMISQNSPIQWASLGTTWTYEGCYFDGSGSFAWEMKAARDTLIEGISARILSFPFELGVIIYQQGDSIYHFDDGAFRLLYDFSLQAGDTLRTYSSECGTESNLMEILIDSVTTVQLGDEILRVQWISYPDLDDLACNCAFFSGPLVEKIGDLGFIVPQYCAVDPPRSCGFIGYSDPACEALPSDLLSIPLGTNDSINVCNFNSEDFVLSNKEWLESPNLSIYPNPTENLLYISIENERIHHIEIFSLFGERVSFNPEGLVEGPSQTIDVSSLSAGVYLMKISANHSYRATFVIGE